MTTFKNIPTYKSDNVFEMTGFNFDISTRDNNDGTEDITFDCPKDAAKFKSLLN